MKADVAGLPVIRSAESETGLVGAAIAACVGLRVHASVSEAAANMVTRVRRFEPRPARAATFTARFARYRQIKQAALALATPDQA
jgi:sugar (pentulose or hexulose) kinase